MTPLNQSNGTNVAIDFICGMTLEPKRVTPDKDDEEYAKLRDMTKKDFWDPLKKPGYGVRRDEDLGHREGFCSTLFYLLNKPDS